MRSGRGRPILANLIHRRRQPDVHEPQGGPPGRGGGVHAAFAHRRARQRQGIPDQGLWKTFHQKRLFVVPPRHRPGRRGRVFMRIAELTFSYWNR